MMSQQSIKLSSDIPISALHLTEDDIERLLTEQAPDIRIDVVKKVADGHSNRTYSLRELVVAEQIFRILLKDLEVSVRIALAAALKNNPNVPHDIIISLSRDVDAVSLPIIECSAVLTDSDLIALIQSAKRSNILAAVTQRKQLSQKISEVIVDTRDTHAISQLMQNAGANISDKSYQNILRDHAKNADVMKALAERPGLPATVVEKVITLVSDALANRLRLQYNISPVTIAIETEKTREMATLKLVDGPAHPHEIEKLVDQLQVFGRLTPSMILTSLCRGNLYFFETSLARLSSVPVRNAQLLIHDKGGLGFKALYAKAGLPEKFFAACKLLLAVVADMQRAGHKKDADALVQKLLVRSSGQNIENLSYIIALIRQNA